MESFCDWATLCLQVPFMQQAGECQQTRLQRGHESSVYITSVGDDQSLPTSLKTNISDTYLFIELSTLTSAVF